MTCINNIATLEPICFKLYGDRHYRLYNYSKNDDLSQLIKKYKLNHNLNYEEFGKLVGCTQSHLWSIEHKKKYPQSKQLINSIMNLIKKDFILYIIVGNIMHIFIS